MNLASCVAPERCPLEIISNNDVVMHMSTESELIKEAFSDPGFLKQVRGPEAMLRVRARVSPGRADTAAAGESTGTIGLLDGNDRDVSAGIKGVRSVLGVRDDFGGAWTALDSAGGTNGIIGLPEGMESDFSKNLADITASDSVLVMGATAGESEGIIGSSRFSESEFPSLNSSRLGSLSPACARRVARCVATAPARVCPGSSSSAVSAAVARAHASTLHDACFNSWSDTVRAQGPTGTKRVKGGVPVRPKICVLSQRWRQG